MSLEANKAISRRYFEEIWNKGAVAAVEQLVAKGAVGHMAGESFRGRDALRERMGSLFSIYTEPCFTIGDQIAEGDRVAVRWSFTGRHSGRHWGSAPSGKPVTITGINIFRIAEGKIAEIWVNSDDLGELHQLGAITPLV